MYALAKNQNRILKLDFTICKLYLVFFMRAGKEPVEKTHYAVKIIAE